MDSYKNFAGSGTELTPEQVQALQAANEQNVAAEQQQIQQQQSQAAAAATPAPTATGTPAASPTGGEPEQKNLFEQGIDWINSIGLSSEDAMAAGAAFMGRTEEEQDAEWTEKQNALPEPVQEVSRAIGGAGADIIESGLNAADLLKDTAVAIAAEGAYMEGMVPESDIPWSKEYEWADYDLGVAETKTVAGGVAKSLLGVLGSMYLMGAGGIKIGAGKSMASRMGTEATKGALFDFFTSPTPNISNMVQDSRFANPLSAALAHQDEDNVFIRKVKNMIEGGTIGAAVDGVTELYGALRAGRKAADAARKAGKSKEEIAKAGTDASIRHITGGKTKLDPGSEMRKAENTANSARPADPDKTVDQQAREIWGRSNDTFDEGLPKYDDLTDAQKADVQKMYRDQGLIGEVPGKMEPHSRANQTTKFDINDVAESQAAKAKVDDAGIPDAGSKPLLREQDFMDFAGDPGKLRSYIEEVAPGIDLKRLGRSLSLQSDEVKERALLAVADFVTDGDMKAFERVLSPADNLGFRGARADGIVAVDVVARDMAAQIQDRALALMDVDAIDGDMAQQAIQLLRRAESLTQLQKELSSTSSFGLKDHFRKNPIPNQGKQLRETQNEISKLFRETREKFELGGPKEYQEGAEMMREMSRGMIFNNGDPTAMVGFWKAMARVGIRNMNQVTINAWLASPLSQVRNLAGNSFVAIERPLALANGFAQQGDWKSARRAFTMYDSLHTSIFEGFKVARKSLMSESPITEGSKLIDLGANTRQEVDMMVKAAKTPTEKWAANMLQMYHWWSNTPVITWPGRGLQAGDDMFKTIVARQDLRYQAAVQADEYGEQLLRDGVENVKGKILTKEDFYQQLVKQKLGPNGEIIDEMLKKSAKDATFQTPLEGTMQSIANDINKYPILKQFVPFLQTPWNVTVYGMQHTPLLARFTDEYQRVIVQGKGTAEEIAMMKGRLGMGYIYTTMGAMGVFTGNITGNGPADQKDRDLWLLENEPMSIKLPNGKWMSYKSLPGLDILLPAIADTALLFEMGMTGKGDKMLSQLLFTVANTITNKAYFQGFQDMSAVFDPSSWGRDGGAGMLKEIAERGSAATLGNLGLMRQIRNALAPGIQEYNDDLQEILGAATGGLSGLAGGATTSYNILNGKQEVRGYEGPFNSVNPFRITSKNTSEAQLLMGKYEYNIPESIVLTEAGIELTIKEQQFIKKNMGKGAQLEKEIKDYFESEDFKAAYKYWLDTQGTVDGKSKEESAWYQDANKIFLSYKKRAVEQLYRSDDPVAAGFRARYDNRGVVDTQRIYTNSLKNLINF